jgi:hypothetical protein
MKKLICVFLAIVMCMALALPVFADDEANVTGTSYSSTVKTPTIKVLGSASNTILLNPYNIAVAKASVVSGDDDTYGTNTQTTAGVIAPTTVLENKSDVPIKLSISVTGSIPQGSTATFSATEPAETEKTHKVFMYVDVKNVEPFVPDDDHPIPAATDALINGIAAYAADKVYSATNTSGTQAVVKAGEVKMTDLLTMAVPDTSGDDDEQGFVTIDVGGVCSSAPQTPWGENDKVAVSLAYTFVASSNSVGSGS